MTAPSLAASDLMREAAQAIRDRTHAVPGFSPSLAALLEACASDPGEAGKHAQAVAEDVLGPRGREDGADPGEDFLSGLPETCSDCPEPSRCKRDGCHGMDGYDPAEIMKGI